jgi:hypothetical protein
MPRAVFPMSRKQPPKLAAVGLDLLFHGGLAFLVLAYVALPAALALYVAKPLGVLGWLTFPAAFYAARTWLSGDRETGPGAVSVGAGRQGAIARLVAEAAPAGCDPPALFGVSLVSAIWIEPSPEGRDEEMLVVGLPLLAALPRRDLGTLIARVLEDRPAGGADRTRWVTRRLEKLEAILEEVDDRTIVGVEPFALHARLFMRLAAGRPPQDVPAEDHSSRAAERLGLAFDGYWANLVAPVLERGQLPPISEGFVRCLDDRGLQEWLDDVVGELAPLDGEPVELEDGRYLEVELVSALRGSDALGQLEPIEWDDVPDFDAEADDDAGSRTPEPVATGSARITRPRRRAVLALVGLVLVGLIGLPMAAVCFAIPFMEGAGLAAAVFGLSMGLLLVLLLGWFAWTRTSLVLRRAHVIWEGQRLTIKHPLLREPLTLRASDLRVIATCADDTAQRRFPISGDGALELYGSSETGWLWATPLGSPLPTLAAAPDPPNVALLFERPVPAPRLRQQLAHGPLKGEAMAGLLIHVEDPSALEQVALSWRLRQSVSQEDAQAALELWGGDELVPTHV